MKAKDRGMKFEIKDKVRIPSVNREGVVVGWHHQVTPCIKNEYEVSISCNAIHWDDHYPVGEVYASRRIIRVNESDLEKIENKVSIDDWKILPTECQHEWQNYVGLNSQYEFCKKCDQKK